jgi:hypothetical protein
MARSGSECLADTLTVGRRRAKAYSESPRLIDTQSKRRNGVPINMSQRLYLALPVFVYRLSRDKEPESLLEVARSSVVYARGGVLVLGATVKLGQELLLVNPQTEVLAACRVAGFESKKNGCQPMVRLEFTQPAPRFWGVMFPPEDGDPAERKLPRVPRRSRRVESSQLIQVRHTEESPSDMCITQNISREGLYFKSEHLSYREGMRLTISFLRHADLFAPNASYTGQIIRVDEIEDGRVGVAVRLLGNIKPPASPLPLPSQPEVSINGIGHVLAVVPGRVCRSLRGTGIRMVCWPVPHFGRMRHLAARKADALVRLGTTVAKLCKNTMGEWRKSAGGLMRSSCSAVAAISLGIGKGTGVQFVKMSSKARGHLEKYLRNLAAALVRAKSLELCPSVPWRQPWLKGIAQQFLLDVTPIRTAFTLTKDNGPDEL